MSDITQTASTSNTSSSTSSSKSENNAAILEQIKGMQKTISVLEDKVKKIEEAMEKVSSCPRDGIAQANSSFRWVVNNMDNYWSATNSVAIEKVKDILTKVGEQCGSGGSILSQEGAIMAAAEAKITEYKDKISLIERQIADLEALLE